MNARSASSQHIVSDEMSHLGTVVGLPVGPTQVQAAMGPHHGGFPGFHGLTWVPYTERLSV